MAKRTTNRPQADASADTSRPEAPKRSRARGNRTAESNEIAAAPVIESAPTTPEELPDIPEPGDAADQAQRYESIVTDVNQPSEDDIRVRAYHRYLERGGQHGGHFDDWLAAERELKRGKS